MNIVGWIVIPRGSSPASRYCFWITRPSIEMISKCKKSGLGKDGLKGLKCNMAIFLAGSPKLKKIITLRPRLYSKPTIEYHFGYLVSIVFSDSYTYYEILGKNAF